MKAFDPLLTRIEAFNYAKGGGVTIRRAGGGYTLYWDTYKKRVARLRPTGDGDTVEILWWSHSGKWASIGDFGGIKLPLDEALEYVAEDPLGCFWE